MTAEPLVVKVMVAVLWLWEVVIEWYWVEWEMEVVRMLEDVECLGLRCCL